MHDRISGWAAGRARIGFTPGLVAAGVVCLAFFARPMPAQDVNDAFVATPTSELSLLPFEGNAAPAFNLAHRPDALDLETPVGLAELVMTARLVDVTESKVVQGGRNVVVTQQFRFEPVRVLKGIYSRDHMLMTGQDLGIYRFAEGTDRLAPGQLLLIFLGRRGGNYFNCNASTTLGQSIPRLDGEADPLLSAVEALVAAGRRVDRSERIGVIRDALEKAQGRAATPLLLTLSRRAVLASRDPAACAAVLPFLKSKSPAVIEVAARTLAAMLDATPRPKGAARLLPNPAAPSVLQSSAADALGAALADAGPDLAARVALIDALGAAQIAAVRRSAAATAWLKAEPTARSFAETAARVRALNHLPAPDRNDEVARAFESLFLDAPADFEVAVGKGLVGLDPDRAARLIPARLARKADAGLDVSTEIGLLGDLPAASAVPALIKVFERTLNPQERAAFAKACVNVPDARLVPALTSLLDPRQWTARAYAIEALRRVDTDEAAGVLVSHIDEEVDPSRRLRLIAFLGRHGLHEADVQAFELLPQGQTRDDAVTAVAASPGPKTVAELRRIWETSNDASWNAGAARALARLGQADIAPRLLEAARTPGNSLAATALLALGDLGTAEALPLVKAALGSRRDDSVTAAARAAAKLLKNPALDDDAIRDALAALLSNADASAAVRQAALDALVALNDPRLPRALDAAARDANLEGTPLLQAIESQLTGRRASGPDGRPEPKGAPK